jgi:hemoglobin
MRPRLIDQLGEARLRTIIEDFYDRIVVDPMIGFLFAGKDRARLVDKEWELIARLLGADVRYTGRSIAEAHRRSPIMGGHFERRLQLLRNVLRDHAVPDEVQRPWIEHSLALRAQVTGDAGSDCDHDVAAARLAAPGPTRAAAAAEPAPAAPPPGLIQLKKR